MGFWLTALLQRLLPCSVALLQWEGSGGGGGAGCSGVGEDPQLMD